MRLTKQDFLAKQLDLIRDIQNGDATWQNLTDLRADYYAERFHNDTTRRGGLLLKEYIEEGWVQKPGDLYSISQKKTISTNNDGSQSSEGKFEVDEDKLRDPEYLLKLHGYDPLQWELTSSKNSFWDVQKKGGEIKKLYSSKILVKPKANGINLDKVKEWYDSFESKKVGAYQYTGKEGGNNCLVLPIADLHYGLLCSAFICGSDYDKKIAEENFYKIINETCERIKDRNISKIMFVLGNDMFNADNIAGTTFKGTPQSNDGHLFEAFIQLSEIVINAIETLSDTLKIKVEVVFVPSNHDKTISFNFIYNLNTYFRNNENVDVDYSPLPRKYYKFGNTLFMLTHDIKLSDVAATFLDEASGMLDGIEYFDCLVAHLHSETVRQDKNLTIRRLPTTSPSSTWANDSNYSSKQVHLSMIYNDKNNITDCMYITV